ncbi:MAG: hypothetical protein AAFR46_02805 [Pseudomonadota bacterium]
MPLHVPPSAGARASANASEEAQTAAAHATHRARRRRELAVILPVLGAFLLVSPVIKVFAAPVALGGIPLIVLYIFGVWAFVIIATAALTRRNLHQASDR